MTFLGFCRPQRTTLGTLSVSYYSLAMPHTYDVIEYVLRIRCNFVRFVCISRKESFAVKSWSQRCAAFSRWNSPFRLCNIHIYICIYSGRSQTVVENDMYMNGIRDDRIRQYVLIVRNLVLQFSLQCRNYRIFFMSERITRFSWERIFYDYEEKYKFYWKKNMANNLIRSRGKAFYSINHCRV